MSPAAPRPCEGHSGPHQEPAGAGEATSNEQQARPMKPEGPPLQLEVSNFGPIAKANIDLRPLTVFVGPSNTGKSYLAILIYALHNHFSADDWMPGGYFTSRRKYVLSPENIHNLSELAERISTKITESSTAESLSLPGPVVEIIRASFNDQGNYIGDQIRRCFGLEKSGNLIRNGIKIPAHVLIRQHVNGAYIRRCPSRSPLKSYGSHN